MTGRAAAVQGLLAAAGLAAAYTTWQREPSLEEGSTFVLDITKNELEKVRYEDGTTWVELTPGNDDAGKFVWVRLSGKKGSNMPMPAGHPVVQTDVPERQVRGNTAATAVWERLAPWQASRSLGVLPEKLVKDLGLDTAKKKLHVTSRGVTRSFALAPSPPGGTEPYVRALDGGAVFIVANQILTDFSAAQSNLIERRFHPFVLQDIDKLVVTTLPAKPGDKGKTKEFQFKRYDGKPGGDLIPVATPGKPDVTATNWHERIFGLFPADVLGRDEKPGPGAPVNVLRLEYFYRGKKLGFLELARGGEASPGGGAGGTGGTDPTTGAPTPRTAALARSEFTAGWMRLSVDAQGLLSEGETIFGQ